MLLARGLCHLFLESVGACLSLASLQALLLHTLPALLALPDFCLLAAAWPPGPLVLGSLERNHTSRCAASGMWQCLTKTSGRWLSILFNLSSLGLWHNALEPQAWILKAIHPSALGTTGYSLWLIILGPSLCNDLFVRMNIFSRYFCWFHTIFWKAWRGKETGKAGSTLGRFWIRIIIPPALSCSCTIDPQDVPDKSKAQAVLVWAA